MGARRPVSIAMAAAEAAARRWAETRSVAADTAEIH